MNLEITSALSSLSAAMSLARVAVEARDDAKIRNALLDMSDRLLAIHAAAGALALENDQLKAQIAQLKQEQVERERFVLAEVSTGCFALRYEPRGDEPTPAHYICQACFSAGKKIVLQDVNNSSLGRSLVCNADSRHNLYLG